MMTLKRAMQITGGLGRVSKMPGRSFGLSAWDCITGSVLATIPGSVCSVCYARRGPRYPSPSVKAAHARRLAALTAQPFDLWVEAMARLVGHYTEPADPYMRWDDSGDLQSLDHLARIVAVARATPWISHWLPTHEPRIVRAWRRERGSVPRNLRIRVSAPMIDGAPPSGFRYTSTVHWHSSPVGWECPSKKLYGNTCGPCRKCWGHTHNVSYPLH